jgi:hypothetical protein
MVGRAAVACNVAVTGGGGGRRQRRRWSAAAAYGGGVWLLSPQLPGARTMRANRYQRRRTLRVLGVFVSGHKFYVCDLRTKHKICILAYHNLCFCVFVLLGMLQYIYKTVRKENHTLLFGGTFFLQPDRP